MGGGLLGPCLSLLETQDLSWVEFGRELSRLRVDLIPVQTRFSSVYYLDTGLQDHLFPFSRQAGDGVVPIGKNSATPRPCHPGPGFDFDRGPLPPAREKGRLRQRK